MEWLKAVFSESSGASFSRVATAVVVVGSIVWITHIVLKTHAIPALDGVTLFNTSIYGMGKINETIQKGLK